jgi:hypothetical protein
MRSLTDPRSKENAVYYGVVGALAFFIAAVLFGGGVSIGAVTVAVVGFIIGVSAAASE